MTYHISTVTILAFIFIPTSLASSVFGMNVQEINNTGKSIWTFIMTAIAITGVALVALWYGKADRSHFSRKQRLSRAMWLIRNPNAWRQTPWGTFLGVLTNGRFGNRFATYYVNSAIRS